MAAALARRSTVRSVVTRQAPLVRRAAVQLARRGATKAAQVAASEKHTIAAVMTAAALGYVRRNNVQVPHFQAIGVPGTIGLVLWAGGRYTGNRTMQHAATGALAIAAEQMVAGGSLFGAPSPAPQPGVPPPQGGGAVMGGAL